MNHIGFFIVAATALVSAILVVRSQNLIRAVLWLGITLLSTAAFYAMLESSFLAGVQVLVYVGGVVTLMIFGVMITRRHEGILVHAENHGSMKGFAVAGSLFAVVAFAIRATDGLDKEQPFTPLTTKDLGRELLQTHVLAFEVVSFLLLAAIIGAIVIARKRDPVEKPAALPTTAHATPSATKEAHP